jgi:GT2 family glycosyltransferase
MKLSIIILNYNTKDLTMNCLLSLEKVQQETNFEIILIDNGSIEDSIDDFRKYKNIRLIESKNNLGFARGNNLARKYAKGEYILFLNSDTEVYNNTLKETIKYLDEHKDVGALTCKTILPNGELDKDARRSFPTPWVAFTHFSGLDKLFPKSKIFAKYWYGYESSDEIQEVDALQGAYFLTRKEIMDKVNWFSEDYFLDGEDIDLSWKVKNVQYKVIYYPKVSILHVKKASKKKRSLKSKMAGVNSMEIFFKLRLWQNYPLVLNLTVILAIYFLKIIRLGRVIIKI